MREFVADLKNWISTDELSHVNSWIYDDAGKMTRWTNARGDQENYYYNNMGWMTSVVNGRGKTRTMEHTDRGEVKKQTLADGSIEQWAYNANGDISRYSSPNGYYNDYIYDDASRLTQVDYPTGTDTNLSYDIDNRQTTMVDSTGTTSWGYNDADELTTLTQPQGTQTYEYNLASQRTKMTEVGQGDTTYAYDSFGRPSSISNRFGETTNWAYDSLGRVSKKTLNPGQYEDYSYDIRNRVTSVVLKNSSNTALRSQSYTYDNASRVLTHTTDGVATTYGYDDASQLTSESRTGYSATYSYDGNGNRLTRNISGGVSETYSYVDGDKLTAVNWSGGSKTYTYDTAGRTKTVVSSAGTTTLDYDYESRLTSISGGGITAETYTYNGLDTRVYKTVIGNTTTYTRDGAYVTDPVLRDSGASYTPGISERRGSATKFNHSGIKNIDAQTGTAQTVAATRQYDAFSNVTASTGTWSGPFGNAGSFGYQEDATGLKLLGHRYYDSSTGRFITRDPIKDGRNWYGYGAGVNNPISIADPNGLEVVTILIIGACVIGVASIYAWLQQQGDLFNDAMGSRPRKGVAFQLASETGDTTAYEDHWNSDVRPQLERTSGLTKDGIENNINPAPIGQSSGAIIHIGVDGYQGFRDLGQFLRRED